MKFAQILCCLASLLFISPRIANAETVRNDAGWELRVDPATGDYQISLNDPAWTVGGRIGQPLDDVASGDGKDSIGQFREIKFRWKEEGQRRGSIRLYRSRPLVLFTVTFDDAVEGCPGPFPILDKLPQNMMEFRYGEGAHLVPIAFQLSGISEKEPYGGPFALFDDSANTLILSPASDFMIAMLDGDQYQGLRSGFNPTLKSVPAGYQHQTLLALGHGINQTWDAWGHGLTDLYSKKRPANDADTGLKYLGYWTDNGATYYYNYDVDKGYAGTLLAEKEHLQKEGVQIHYLQLDSWWYPKTFNSVQADASNKPRSKNPKIPAGTWNRYGGLLEFTPHPDLFPQGLVPFQKKLDAALITHNRWIDPQSPYHADYKISGIAGVDPKWWNKIISAIASWGVRTYEQDWNNYIYRLSPELSSTTWAGDAYMDGMANACAANGVTMQYCMVLPRHLMQGGAKYSNLTTVRVSGDRFEPKKWQEFLYGSEMAKALGVWPWTDVFRSKETPNILVATLSAGMVGLADAIGAEDLANISRAARADGVIVKPDEPITPTDATFIAAAQGQNVPTVCSTTTTHPEAGDAGKAIYVFAYSESQVTNPKKSSKETKVWSIETSSLGLPAQIFDYDFFNNTGNLVQLDQTISDHLNNQGWSYHIFVPVGPSGMAFIGDTGKFVTRGKKRISSMNDDATGLRTTLLACPSEKKLTLAVYSPSKPIVHVTNGSCDQITYDPSTQIARAQIAVDPSAAEIVIDGDPIIKLEVTFETR